MKPGKLKIVIILIYTFLHSAPAALNGEKRSGSGDPLEFTSFLLPDPAELFVSTDPTHSNGMDQLFAAPLLSRELILDQARANQQNFDRYLTEKRTRVATALCGLPEDERLPVLARLSNQLEIELLDWNTVQSRYDAMVIYHAQKIVAAGELDATLNGHRVVMNLQRERTRILSDHWRELLNLAGDGCNPDDLLETVELPGERLFEPIALARYKFFRALPHKQRKELILALASGRSTDK